MIACNPTKLIAAGVRRTAWLRAAALLAGLVMATAAGAATPRLTHGIVYQDERYYAAFPSVVQLDDGELLVAFRRAPSRRALGEPRESHVDPNSYLVLSRSRDQGRTWSAPELLHAYSLGGSQDPCLLRLRDGSLLCASYAWAFLQPEIVPKLTAPVFQNRPGVVFLGGYLLRSRDRGHTWSEPIVPPHIAPEVHRDPYGRPLPAYNRGALVEARDGRLHWVVAATDRAAPRKTSTHLLTSEDAGNTWRYSAPVAVDERVTFNEASVFETRRGDLVAFLRTAGFEDHAVLARSTDGGRSFQPWQDMGWKGHPLQALQLADGRVFLTYGYRHAPFGIRARILDADCSNFATAPEIVLRDDGGNYDLGYPWATQLADGRVLVVYYFNLADGPRHIAVTTIEL